jgi:hypothetical protein
MDLEIPRSIAHAFISVFPKHKVLTKDAYVHSSTRHIDSDEFDDAQITLLRSLVRDEIGSSTLSPRSKYRKELKELFGDLDSIVNLSEWADKEELPKVSFRYLQPVWDEYVKRVASRGWVVRVNAKSSECGAWLYLGSDYYPAQRNNYGVAPEHWDYDVVRMHRGRIVKERHSVWGWDVMGAKTFADVAKKLDLLPANDTFLAEYDELKIRYEKHRVLIGEQYLGMGGRAGVYTVSWRRDDDEESGSLNGKETDLSAGGRPTRMVIDDNVSWAEKSRDASIPEAYAEHEIPDALVIRCFSLDHHIALAVHVRLLTPYDYDDKVVDKLIIPGEVKTLVRVLMQASLDGTSSVADVVRNKMGGTTILSHGPPGTGKTLTAEVFAETMKRPLYVVQCSQLGLDPDTIEKELDRVLRRAERWKAILLLDEADVYVMKRGSDINQNAIVGVFLRVMEYFDGILVLTTNRGEDVDDAIRSRCIAEIPYSIPQGADRPKLWGILCAHYGLTVTTSECKTLAEKFPDFSGRDIKQLARLVRVNALDAKGKKLIEAFETFAKFKPCHVGKEPML